MPLLPCPACKSDKPVMKRTWFHSQVVCEECGYKGKWVPDDNPYYGNMKAEEAWNNITREMVWSKNIPDYDPNDSTQAFWVEISGEKHIVWSGAIDTFKKYVTRWAGPIPLPCEPKEKK